MIKIRRVRKKLLKINRGLMFFIILSMILFNPLIFFKLTSFSMGYSNFLKNNATPIQDKYNLNTNDSIRIDKQFCLSHAPVEWVYHANNTKILNPAIVRNNIEWFACKNFGQYAKDEGKYNFSLVEKQIYNLHSRGMEYLGCFVYGWGWWPNNHEVSKEDWPYYLDFVGNFSAHFKDSITYYEMWNEPNIGFWPDTDENFFQFLKLITDKVRENDPTAKILCPSVSGTDTKFLEKMINYYGEEEFNNLFDIFTFHAYSDRNGEDLTNKIRIIKELMNKHNFTGELWITEIGLTTSLPTEQLKEEMLEERWKEQAYQLVKLYPQAIAENVSTLFWYCQNDWCDVPNTNGEGRFGLYYCDDPINFIYKLKPAGYSYQTLNQLLRDSIYFPNLIKWKNPLIERKQYWSYYFYTPRNTIVFLAWNQNPSTALTLSISEKIDTKIKFSLRMYNYLDNTTKEFQDLSDFSFNLDYRPVIFEINFTNSNSTKPEIIIESGFSWKNIGFIIIPPIIFLFALTQLIKWNKINKIGNTKKNRIKNINKGTI